MNEILSFKTNNSKFPILKYKFYNKPFLNEFLSKYKIIEQLKNLFNKVTPTKIKLGEFGFGWSIDNFKTLNYEMTEELESIKSGFSDWKNDVAIPVIKKSDEVLNKCYLNNDLTFLMTTIKDSSGSEINKSRKNRYIQSIIYHDNYVVERKVQNDIIKLLMFVENKYSKFDLKRCIDFPFDEEINLKCDLGSKFIYVPNKWYSVFVNDRNYSKDAGNMFIPIAWVTKNDDLGTIYYCENVLYTIKKSINNFSRIDKVMNKYR